MKITNQRRTNLRKRFVLFTLIAAMLITLVPAANVSAASAAYLTEDPNADLYPFPLDMNFLSKYLYGSAENTKGTVATYYAKEVPNEWLPREMPAEDLKAPVVDLERSSTPAGNRVYILSRARTFISLMQETSSWIFRS